MIIITENSRTGATNITIVPTCIYSDRHDLAEQFGTTIRFSFCFVFKLLQHQMVS